MSRLPRTRDSPSIGPRVCASSLSTVPMPSTTVYLSIGPPIVAVAVANPFRGRYNFGILFKLKRVGERYFLELIFPEFFSIGASIRIFNSTHLFFLFLFTTTKQPSSRFLFFHNNNRIRLTPLQQNKDLTFVNLSIWKIHSLPTN